MSEIITALKALRLHGMAAAYADLLQDGGSGSIAASHWLIEHLLEAEHTDRAMRSVRYQLNAARFPIHRDLAATRYSPLDEVNRANVSALQQAWTYPYRGFNNAVSKPKAVMALR